jgi:AraC-like DNA-binding protein
MHRDGGPYLPARLVLLPGVRYDVTQLTQRPGDFAQSSDNRVGSQMDVLSTLLKTVKLEGAMFYNAEFSAPWSIRSPHSCLVAPYLSRESRHVIMYHLLTHGRAYANVEDGQRVSLSAGDIVVFPHGDPHIMGNGRDVEPRDHGRILEEILSQGLKLARMGGGGEITRFICGYLVCEPQLSEALFAETLRRYVDLLPPGQTGWLAGARDAEVGNALALVHRQPSDPWTIAELARRVGVSRSVLAERFRHFLGVPPIAYLTRWRMQLGAQLLTSTRHSVAQIAAEVGYESEPAFNRAFKRAFGSPPARFRTKSKVAAGH